MVERRSSRRFPSRNGGSSCAATLDFLDVSKIEFQAITSSRFSDVMCESLSVRVHDLSHKKSQIFSAFQTTLLKTW